MPLLLSDEQLLLKESLERFVEKDYGFESRQRALESEDGFSREHWQRFAELGWLAVAVAVPEEYGGLGGGPVEQTVVCEAFGRAMVLEPYVSTAVLGARLLGAGRDETRKREMLESVAAGTLLLAAAFAERAARYDLEHVRDDRAVRRRRGRHQRREDRGARRAERRPARRLGPRLGRHPGGAWRCPVPRRPGGPGREGPSLRDDGRHAGERLRLRGRTRGACSWRGDAGLAALAAGVEDAIVATSARAVGAMAAAQAQTLEYVKTREQFGVPIGSFQALQHRLVEMFMAVRECQSMVLMAASEIAASTGRGSSGRDRPRPPRRSWASARTASPRRSCRCTAVSG